MKKPGVSRPGGDGNSNPQPSLYHHRHGPVIPCRTHDTRIAGHRPPVSASEMLDALHDALAQAGQPVDRIEVDGEIHRYHPEGKHDQPCWYVAHWVANGQLIAHFGDHRLDPAGKGTAWRSWEQLRTGDPVDRQAIAAEQAERRHHERQSKTRRQARAARKARALWETLSETGESAYLKRKQVPALGVRFGQDRRGQFIAVPMRGPSGDLRGLQFIYDDGTKHFSAGVAKKGSYHLIGAIESGKPFYPAEGYATAASAHLAMGCAAVVCFDAGNIGLVLEGLRKLYPEQLVGIAADNDQWNPQVGNIGETKAKEAARRYKAFVALPDFTGLDVSGRPTDFNDLQQLAGLKEVRRQLQAAAPPPSELPPFILPEGGYQGPHRLLKINAPYITPNLISGEGVFCVDSYLGSGKTTTAKFLVEQALAVGKRVLYIAPRQSLCGDAARRLGLADYRDFEQEGGEGYTRMQAEQALAICLPSLPKLVGGPVHDLIILDEAAQDLDILLSNLVKDQRVQVFDALMWLLRNAKRVLCLDGTMDHSVIPVLEAARPGEQFTYIRNEHQPHLGKTIDWYESCNELHAMLPEHICAGECLFITCDSREQAKRIHTELTGLFPDLPGYVIHGENSQGAEVKTILADINGWIQQARPRWLVCSPSVGTGVSIEVEHFDREVGFFEGQSVTSAAAFQQLRRLRHVPQIDVYVRSLQRRLETDPAVLRQQFLKTAQTEAGLVRLDWDTGIRCVQDPTFERLWVGKRVIHNRDQNQFAERLRGWLYREGYSLRVHPDASKLDPKKPLPAGLNVPEALARIELGKEMQRQARSQTKQAHIQNITEANPVLCMSQADRERIRNSPAPTQEEKWAAVKYDIAQFNGCLATEVTAEMVTEHDGYRLQNKVCRVAEAGLSEEAVSTISRAQQQNPDLFHQDITMLATRRALIRGILAHGGISFDKEGKLCWDGTPWSEETLEKNGLLTYLQAHAQVINYLEGLPSLPGVVHTNLNVNNNRGY